MPRSDEKLEAAAASSLSVGVPFGSYVGDETGGCVTLLC